MSNIISNKQISGGLPRGWDMPELRDRSQDRKYFTQLPNLIDDSGLSPYAVRLYLHIKRRAGENGSCYETCRGMAEACKMGRSTISKARRELEAAGLIDVEIRPGQHGHLSGYTITVIDIWPTNIEYYNDQSMAGTGESDSQSTAGTGKDDDQSTRETPPVRQINPTSPPDELKEEPIKNNQIKEERKSQKFFTIFDVSRIFCAETSWNCLPSSWGESLRQNLRDVLQTIGEADFKIRVHAAAEYARNYKSVKDGHPANLLNAWWADYVLTGEIPKSKEIPKEKSEFDRATERIQRAARMSR
jgi:hypothetical protein